MRDPLSLRSIAMLMFLGAAIAIPTQFASAQTFQSCLVENEDALFAGLQQRASEGYAAAHQEFDFAIHVQNAWRQVDMTSIIETAAREAGTRYGGDRFFEREANRRLTSYSRSRAETAVEAIADQTFSSAAVRDGLESVIEASVDRFLTFLVRRSEGVAIDMGQCFSDFLSINFPPIVQSAANQHFSEIHIDTTGRPSPLAPGPSIAPPAVLGPVLVAIGALRRQIVTRITGQITTRIAARLATRAIPYVGWALIGFEIIWQRDGAIPEIIDSMTGVAIIQGLQAEIAREITDEVGRQMPQISREVVRETMSGWQSFVVDNETVLTLSQTNERFRRYLEQFSSNDDLAPVRDAVALIVGLGGEDALNEIIDRGQMSAVLRLGVPGQTLARETGSLQTALAWSERAPNRLDEVLFFELYRHKSPAELSTREINFILDLRDQELIRSAALLPSDDVRFLSQIDRVSVAILLETLPTDQTLDAIEALRSIRTQDAQNAVWRHISGDRYAADTIIADLQIVGASRNQSLAAQMIFAPPSFFSQRAWVRIPQDFLAATSGDVSWRLLLNSYHRQLLTLGGIILFLFLFGWLRKPRRQEVVIRHEKQ